MRFPPQGLPIRGDSAANPTAPGAPYGPLGAPVGRPVGFGVHFRIALAGRALRIHAPGHGVGVGVFAEGEVRAFAEGACSPKVIIRRT